MNYLFSSESVSEGHPDKIADQISDAILDNYLAFDQQSKVACETFVTTGQVIIGGEVHSNAHPDHQKIIRGVIRDIGYTKEEYCFSSDTCGIISALHAQSPDIRQGVEKADPKKQGAGDQGMMFGYATNETDTYLPLTLDIAHKLVHELSLIRKEGKEMKYLRPDAKSQVTIEYTKEHHPVKIDSLVISTQHDEFIPSGKKNKRAAELKMQKHIRQDIEQILFPRVVKKLPTQFRKFFNEKFTLHVNPTGTFIIGGPHGDTGLTGRKIIVDTYGGRGAHGGGAFSGKDPSKVDRSAAYAARYVAKNLVKAGICDQALVQLSYAIGVAEPCGFYVNTNGTAKVNLSDVEISKRVRGFFDLTPYGIEQRLKLRNPIYSETAAYGHVGRDFRKGVIKTFKDISGNKKKVKVDLFTWEQTDAANDLRKLFKIK